MSAPDNRFDLTGRVAVITGGAGLLGSEHARAIVDAGGIAVIADIDAERAAAVAADLSGTSARTAIAIGADITVKADVERLAQTAIDTFGRIDILINNAAMTVKGGGDLAADYFAAFEDYPLELWEQALKVNLTGAFLCCQVVGRHMVSRRRGVVLNIASDVGNVSPDHRIYDGVVSPHTGRPFNTPASYATTKAGIINFTRYLATYWAPHGIRVNSLSPGGVFANHDPAFVREVSKRIPLGRMANADEYRGAVLFLVSDASSYVTGTNLIADGGRTAW